MPRELAIGSATIANELRSDPSLLDSMLSTVGSIGRGHPEGATLLRVMDSKPKPTAIPTKMGSEGFFWDGGVSVRLRGNSFAFEWDAGETRVYVERVTPFPFLLPFLLSRTTGGMIAPVHACAIQAGGEGILIAGPGSSGRTGLMLELVEAGAGFIADDVCMVSGDGEVAGKGPCLTLRCELAPSGVKDNLAPILKHRNPFPRTTVFRRNLIRAAGFAAKSSPDRLARVIIGWSRAMGFAIDIDSRAFWPQGVWIERSRIGKVLLCSIDPTREGMIRIEPEEAGRVLVVVNRFELRDYLKLMQVVAFANPETGRSLMQSWQTFEETLARSVARAECFLVRGSRSYLQTRIPEAILGGGRDVGR